MVFVFRYFYSKRWSNANKKLIQLFHRNLVTSYLRFVDNQATRKIVFLDFELTSYVFDYFPGVLNIAVIFSQLILKLKLF